MAKFVDFRSSGRFDHSLGRSRGTIKGHLPLVSRLELVEFIARTDRRHLKGRRNEGGKREKIGKLSEELFKFKVYHEEGRRKRGSSKFRRIGELQTARAFAEHRFTKRVRI